MKGLGVLFKSNSTLDCVLHNLLIRTQETDRASNWLPLIHRHSSSTPARPRGPSGWAHAGPKWVGPRGAQVGPSQKFGTQQKPKKKSSKCKSVLPKMSARSGLVGNKSSWPHLGPPGPIFCVGRKNQKNANFLPIFLGGPMGTPGRALQDMY